MNKVFDDCENMKFKFNAFGLIIESEFKILQLPNTDITQQADVYISSSDLSNIEVEDKDFYIEVGMILIGTPDKVWFKIIDGSQIIVNSALDISDSLLSVYLIGSCMGAILHQRGMLPLHGSCVTNGADTVLIMGNSGAGKSTLAAEFLANGWKLLTDDVAVIKEIDGIAVVQSSFPSQKLWIDSLNNSFHDKEQAQSLYTQNNQNKYNVSVEEMFYEGTVPLSHIVRLIAADEESGTYPIEGMAKVNQLMANTYCPYMILKENQPRHFQRCITLAQKVPMSLVIRKNGEQSAPRLYEMICNTLRGE